MGSSATAQCPATPKPQYPFPGPDHPPPPVLTVAELEAAVAALPGKRDALRKAFDRLAACSPSPLPFAWEDLDAHLSSLQWSISLRFLQLRALEAARPAPAFSAPPETRGDGAGVNLEEEEVVEVEEVVVEQEEEVVEQEEEEADEEMQECDDEEAGNKIGKDGEDEEGTDELLEEDEVVKASPYKIGNEIKDDKDADEVILVANEEQSIEDGKRDKEDANMEDEQSIENAREVSEDKEDANMEDEQSKSMEDANEASLDKEEEQDAHMEVATKKASTVQSKEQEACGEKQVEEEEEEEEEDEAHEEEQDAKNTTKEKGEQAKKVSWGQGSRAYLGPVEFNDLAASFTNMDAQRLVKLIHTNAGLSSEFHAAMHHAPDGAALTLRVIKLFLHDKALKTNKVWNNCIGLIRTVPEVFAKLSTECIEQAKWLAKGWKEMIDNPQSCMTLGSLASWGLLNFLCAYNIVSEFDTKEIFHLFSTLPRKKQKIHSILVKGLGLANRIPELMDYLIGNGQQMIALYLAPIFNLVEKYPPLSLLKGYVKKAKQTVMEISQKNLTRQSLRAVVVKELDNLRIARVAANQQITDSGLRAGIIAEIHVLLRKFGKMNRSLADASTAVTSNPHQQQMESKKKRKKAQAQEHHRGQDNQQQRQQSKPRQEQQQKEQNKPQQEQQQKERNKPPQKQEVKPQEKQQQNKRPCSNRPRRRTPKPPAQASPAAPNVRCHSGQPPYSAMHGVHHGYPAQTGWPGVHYCSPPPPAPQLGAPEYVGPLNPFYQHPQFYPQ